MTSKKRLLAVNYEIYDQQELERFAYLKEKFAIEQNSVFIRSALKRLYDIVKDEELDKIAVREALKKGESQKKEE